MVYIGDAKVLSGPISETITPDDRQEVIPVLGGNVVQDFGVIDSGRKISWECTFLNSDWDKIVAYWTNRTVVTVQETDQVDFQARVVIKSYSRIQYFRNCAVKAQLEFWNV